MVLEEKLMHEQPIWSSIAITCCLAMVIGAIAWNRRKNSTFFTNSKNRNLTADTIPELPKPRWVKVGQVKELYMYPLKSGKGRKVTECEFTEYGMRIKENGLFTLRDRMFLVYDEDTKHFQTARNYEKLVLVNLTAVDECTMKLETADMPDITFNVDEKCRTGEIVQCKMWFSEELKCTDCGPEVAEWLSTYLTGKSSGLRMGYAANTERNILRGPWERFAKVYNTMRQNDAGLFADIMSYMLLTSQSLDELNKRLEKPVPAIQFRPNIIVTAQKPFEEDNWEWIKIGDAVIRNVKPCPRCKMITYNPETGIAETEEPLKTLQTFRQQTDPRRIAVDGKAPLMGVYCGLYVPGYVRIGEEVFVHIPDGSQESDNEENAVNTRAA